MTQEIIKHLVGYEVPAFWFNLVVSAFLAPLSRCGIEITNPTIKNIFYHNTKNHWTIIKWFHRKFDENDKIVGWVNTEEEMRQETTAQS